MGDLPGSPPTVARSAAQQQAVNEADTEFMQYLEKLTLLDKGSEYKAVALAARQKLISSQLPSMKRLREHIVQCLRGGSDMGSEVGVHVVASFSARPLSYSEGRSGFDFIFFILNFFFFFFRSLTRAGSFGFSAARQC